MDCTYKLIKYKNKYHVNVQENKDIIRYIYYKCKIQQR